MGTTRLGKPELGELELLGEPGFGAKFELGLSGSGDGPGLRAKSGGLVESSWMLKFRLGRSPWKESTSCSIVDLTGRWANMDESFVC
jgi:hypothetical protein